ncbi:Lrp/AsnC family transcriptional regulator [Leifsonia sp. H3M29-4]|uniref:Lrp/AsnC family transcriptional regulator n=1 Tax=Salinibacterium metalliresistens TaxID=3031321 RepID=UPI0023DB998B|nr:Lrp/AsnC family transcriptional regulator [Salinibacterium metalliresistens]MDF1479393.1 Lrp/AsnC family transcriptional regulator [Salinibacterium metalliresistens]
MDRLDAVDRRLLAELAQDHRATVVALADRLSLSRNTVQARLARLERDGAFLDFDRAISPAALGFPLEAFIAVHVEQKVLAAVVQALAGIPEVVQAHGLSGPVDLLAHVVCRDANDLFRIDGAILAIEGVQRTETSLSMGELLPYRMRQLLG